MDAASVVCRQAGFDSAIGVANPDDYFDRSMDPLQKIWLDDVYCTGDEQTLLSCVDNPGKASCTHDDDAAVICGGKSLARKGQSAQSSLHLDVSRAKFKALHSDQILSFY